MSCKLNKKDCVKKDGCVWIPSKGCRVDENVPLAVLAKAKRENNKSPVKSTKKTSSKASKASSTMDLLKKQVEKIKALKRSMPSAEFKEKHGKMSLCQLYLKYEKLSLCHLYLKYIEKSVGGFQKITIHFSDKPSDISKQVSSETKQFIKQIEDDFETELFDPYFSTSSPSKHGFVVDHHAYNVLTFVLNVLSNGDKLRNTPIVSQVVYGLANSMSKSESLFKSIKKQVEFEYSPIADEYQPPKFLVNSKDKTYVNIHAKANMQKLAALLIGKNQKCTLKDIVKTLFKYKVTIA